MKRKYIDFTTGNIGKPLIAFSIPLFLGNILQQLYSITDAMIVGNLLGPEALAAIGATSPITNLSISLAIGVTLGVSVTVSQFFGANDNDNVRLTISTGYIFFLFFGIAIMIVAVLFPICFNVKTFGLWPLFAACMTNGLGFLFVQLTNQQTVGHLSTPKTRTNNFAFLAMGYSAANLSAPIASGYLIDHLGFQSAYTLALSAVVLGLLAFILFIRSKLPSSWNRPKVVKRKGNFELMGIPHVRNVLIASSFMSMAWDLQSFMIPVYGTEIGLSASEVGWILGVFAAATFFVRLFMPIIARHLTEWQTITCAFALGAASYALFPIFNNFYMLSAVAFLLGMALGSSQPNVMSLIHTESPPGRTGEALGLRTMLINLCHTTLPIIFGGAGNLIGAGAVFYVVASLMGGVSVFTSRCQKQSVSRTSRRVVEELEQERSQKKINQ